MHPSAGRDGPILVRTRDARRETSTAGKKPTGIFSFRWMRSGYVQPRWSLSEANGERQPGQRLGKLAKTAQLTENFGFISWNHLRRRLKRSPSWRQQVVSRRCFTCSDLIVTDLGWSNFRLNHLHISSPGKKRYLGICHTFENQPWKVQNDACIASCACAALAPVQDSRH